MGEDLARATYDAFAPIYNEFNHLNDYEMWLGEVLLPELEKHGLKRGRALDVGCGTGRAFGPLLRRGWEVRACDLSPGMLERAREEGGDEVQLDVVDMRELPAYGEFELVLSMNDAVNYLLGDEDLEQALARMRANVAADGLLLFDVNSKGTYDSGFWSGSSHTVEYEGRSWTWSGIGEAEGEPGVYETRIEGDDILEPIVHRERFRSEPEIRAAMSAAGLDCVATLGMQEIDNKVVLSDPPDEGRDYKVVYIGAVAVSAV
ncbi:MAG TPA: class I SAM-dependent methyltransferase [Solirubrobacterales bacterium]|nr:class I SAM-dependent methyltransferase [Solirubrobacterales bacterium]